MLRKGAREASKMRKGEFKYPRKKEKNRKDGRRRKTVGVSLNQLMEQTEMECNSTLRFFLITFPVFPTR